MYHTATWNLCARQNIQACDSPTASLCNRRDTHSSKDFWFAALTMDCISAHFPKHSLLDLLWHSPGISAITSRWNRCRPTKPTCGRHTVVYHWRCSFTVRTNLSMDVRTQCGRAHTTQLGAMDRSLQASRLIFTNGYYSVGCYFSPVEFVEPH